jgi:hypothetical protein
LNTGFSIVQIRLIFHPITSHINVLETPGYLTYAQRFNIVPQSTLVGRAMVPDPLTSLYVLKRALRSDKSRMGDTVPLHNYRMPTELLPRFGKVADNRLTTQNSMEYSLEFFLNRYFDKETFHYLLNSNP